MKNLPIPGSDTPLRVATDAQSNAILQQHGTALAEPSSESFHAPFAERAEVMLARVFRGIHHLQAIKREPSRIVAVYPGSVSSFDNDLLTRLIIGAHVYCVRAELKGSAFGRVRIIISDREPAGESHERHPSLEEAITNWETK